METPCIDVCQINHTNGFCEGCWRSIAEITAWAKMTPTERRAVMDDLPARADAAQAAKAAHATQTAKPARQASSSQTPQRPDPAADWEA